MIETIMLFFGVLAAAIFFHELGHIMYFEYLGRKDVGLVLYYKNWRKFGVRVGEDKDYENLTNKQYFMINYIGVSLGILFITFAAYMLNLFLILLLFPYLFGSAKDIENIYNAWRGKYDEPADSNNNN